MRMRMKIRIRRGLMNAFILISKRKTVKYTNAFRDSLPLTSGIVLVGPNDKEHQSTPIIKVGCSAACLPSLSV